MSTKNYRTIDCDRCDTEYVEVEESAATIRQRAEGDGWLSFELPRRPAAVNRSAQSPRWIDLCPECAGCVGFEKLPVPSSKFTPDGAVTARGTDGEFFGVCRSGVGVGSAFVELSVSGMRELSTALLRQSNARAIAEAKGRT